MNPSELAEAVSCWIKFKNICGYEQLLSEGLLVMPIAEYLMGKGSTVSLERDYRTIFGKQPGEGYLSYDVDTICGNEKLIAEVKYLKTVKGRASGSALNVGRVFEDIAKLAYPLEPCRRLLIIGIAKNVCLNSALGDLVNTKEIKVVGLSDKHVTPPNGSPVVLSERISRAMNLLDGQIPSSCDVELVGGSKEARAVVFEIHRKDAQRTTLPLS